MATHPQGHSLVPADHVTTPQQNIQLATTLPLNITPSHLSLSTTQPPASEIVVGRQLLPASDPANTATIPTTPKNPNAYVTDSPPKRRKIDTFPHHTPTTQAVVDALSIPPFQQHENTLDAQPVAHQHTIANASLAPKASHSIDKPINSIETDTAIASAPELVRETPSPPIPQSPVVVPYVPEPSSPAPSVTTTITASPPTSHTPHRLCALNSSLDTSLSPTNVPDANVPDANVPDANVPDADVPDANLPDANLPDANVPDVLSKRRKRDSSATSETHANGQLSSHHGELQEPELKRLKSAENGMPNAVSSGTKPLKADEKSLAIDAEPTDPSQTNLPANADGEATKNENHSDISDVVHTDSDIMQVDSNIPKPTKVAKSERAVSASVPQRTGISLPVLRSSPITTERDSTETRATISKADEVDDGGDPQKVIDQGDVQGDGQENAPTLTRKKKSVSWASEEKLVDVQYIDTRMELVRSWDADSQVTLPFAPATLQMFQQALKDQDTGNRKEGQSDGKGSESLLLQSMPKLSSFEEARKREHDMEQERAQQAREKLKERLNAMAPTTSWRTPGAIVLPAECRIEEPVQRFDLATIDAYSETLPADPDAGSPPSPPYRPRVLYDAFGADSANIPAIPLSDRLNQSGDVGFEGSAVIDNGDSRDYMRSKSRQDVMGDTPSRGRRNSDRGINYKASSDSSKEYRYSGSDNDDDANLPHSSRSDSRTTQPSHGQYDMAPNNYSDINPAPASSQVQAVQHLLSALQSSGLLKPGGGSGAVKNSTADYKRQSVPMHGHGTSDGNYRESQHGDQRELRNQDRDTYEKETQEDDRARTDTGIRNQGIPTADGTIAPPLLGRGMGAAFGPGMQQAGMMDMMAFGGAMGAPPMGAPPLGMPPMGMPPGGMPPGGMPPGGMPPGGMPPGGMPPGGMPPGGMPPGGIPPGGIPPPPIGIPPLGMLQMMGLPVAMMSMPPGLAMTDGGQGQGTSGGGNHGGSNSGRTGSGRVVETISRPKPKAPKQRKRCKYFGTKQGCRDGNGCMFAHN